MGNLRVVQKGDNTNSYSVLRRPEQDPQDGDGEIIRHEPMTYSVVQGSHTDRARAFSMRTMGLSTVVGTSAVVGAVVLAGIPVFSLIALMYLIGGYLVTWTIAYVLDAAVSPEGNQLIDTLLFYRHIGREQRHRHHRMEQDQWTE